MCPSTTGPREAVEAYVAAGGLEGLPSSLDLGQSLRAVVTSAAGHGCGSRGPCTSEAGTCVTEDIRAALDGFRRHYLDSLQHALSHYSELNLQGESFHDRKWAVLSVAHAAEVFCNMLLTELVPRRHRGRYPPFDKAVKSLQGHSHLSSGERRVVSCVFPPLAKLRNRLMHEPAPTCLEIVDATVALLALLYLSRRRLKVSASELFDQDPPIEINVLDELGLRAQEQWFRLAEELVLEDYGEQNLETCENCGCFAPVDLGCQACFGELQPDHSYR